MNNDDVLRRYIREETEEKPHQKEVSMGGELNHPQPDCLNVNQAVWTVPLCELNS